MIKNITIKGTYKITRSDSLMQRSWLYKLPKTFRDAYKKSFKKKIISWFKNTKFSK